MAKLAARNLNHTLNSVALEDEYSNSALNITQETPVVTTFADAGPRRIVANYDYNISAQGFCDFASAQGDATIFGLVGSSGVASGWDPTGNAAGANDPNYDSTSMVLESYSITAAIGNAMTYQYQIAGNAALSRAVA